MKYTTAIFIAMILLAGLLQSCKHDPVSTRPDSNEVDTTHYVLRVTPDSMRTEVANTVVYTATLTPGPFAKPYKLEWVVDGKSYEQVNVDTLSVQFATEGPHSIRVIWLDSAGKTKASDSTIATATTVVSPNDTTSHSFVWAETTIGSESSLNSVFVFDSANIYLTGSDLWTLSGNQWVTVPVKDQDGFPIGGALANQRIFGFSPNDFWLVGGSLVYHCTGGGRATLYRLLDGLHVMTSTDGILRASWGTSSKNMYFVGDKGTIIHFDGTTWTNLPKVTPYDLGSIYGTSDHDIWACGWNSSTGKSALLHFNGVSWTSDPLSNTVATENMWACDSAGVTFAYSGGGWLERKRDSGPWIRDSGVPNGLPDGTNIGIGFRGNSPNDIIAAGGWGTVAHWSGKSWKKYDQFFDYSQAFYGAADVSMKGNTVCVVGVKSGGSWILLGRR